MKKYLLVLLISTFAIGQTNPTAFNKIKVTGATKKNDATRVVVQDSITKEYHWVLKSTVGTGTVTEVTGTDGITVASGTTTPVIGINTIAQSKVADLTADLDTINNRISTIELPDAILEFVTPTRTGSVIDIAALDFTWRIDLVEYTNAAPFSTTIADATAGYNRIDIIVANTSGTFQKIQGVESLDIAVKPDILPNTVEVTFISVSGTTISDPSAPINGDAYIAKASAVFKKVYGTGNIAQTLVVDDLTSFRIMEATSIASLQVNAANKKYIFAGKDHYIKNDTGTILTIKHNSGTGNYKYFFPNVTDLVLQNNEIVHFKIKTEGSSGSLDYVGTSLVSGVNIKTINGTSVLGSGDIAIVGGGGDMVLASAQTVTGEKTFLDTKFSLRNVANTFSSYFTNTNTASRIYTLQNRAGTLLDNTDLSTINSSLATKQSVFTGTTNYLPKSSNSTTLVPSRLFDNGTYFGIGTVNTPTKDFALGNQADREIGIEESDNTVVGKTLSIKAGRTINYLPNVNFNALNQSFLAWQGIAVHPSSNNVYAVISTGTVYKQTNGTGNFTSFLSVPSVGNQSGQVAASPSGNIYICTDTSGLYKYTNETGSFVAVSGSPASPRGVTIDASNNVYVAASNGDIYKQTNETGAFAALGQTSRGWRNMATSPTGNVYALVGFGDIYKQTGGTGNFVAMGLSTGGAALAMTITPNNNVYYTRFNGDIYKQTNETGSFVALGQTSRLWGGIAASPGGNVYAVVESADIYLQNNNVTGTADLNGGTFKTVAGTGKGTGSSNWEVYTGQKLASGTDMQTETLRMKIDNEGNVGIGTASPFTTANQTSLSINGTTASRLDMFSGGTRRAGFYADATLSNIGSVTAIPLTFSANNTEWARITASGNFLIGTTTDDGIHKGQINGSLSVNGVIKLKGYTVSTLPAGVQGDTAFVTDALAPSYLVTVVGGGAVVTVVFYNGSSWVSH